MRRGGQYLAGLARKAAQGLTFNVQNRSRQRLADAGKLLPGIGLVSTRRARGARRDLARLNARCFVFEQRRQSRSNGDDYATSQAIRRLRWGIWVRAM